MMLGMKTGNGESEEAGGCKVAYMLVEAYWDNVENSFSWQVFWLSFVREQKKYMYSSKQGQDKE